MPIALCLIFAGLAELFALAHHAALAARSRSAVAAGTPEMVATRQSQVLHVQLFAATIVLMVASVRAVRGVSTLAPAAAYLLLFVAVFVSAVYWRYPEAAPFSISSPDWTEDSGVGLMRLMRYGNAGLAGLLAAILAVGLSVGG